MLSDRQPKLSTRGQKTKIHAVLDKDTVYSPTDNQSYQRADRRQKYMQYKTKTLYILQPTTKLLKRGQKTKIHAVQDENTVYPPTDDQSY